MSFNFDTLVNTIKDSLSTKTVIGDPLQFGNVTLVPIMSAYFGFGGGGGNDGGTGAKGPNSGVGGGGGARLSVTGMIVIKDDEVSFLPAGRGSSIERIMDSIPDIIEQATKTAKQTAGNMDAEAVADD